MNENEKQAVALFRLAVLGDLIHAELGPGDQKRLLAERAATSWNAPHGAARQYSARTIEGWLYAYRKRGFDGLLPTARRDKGTTRAISDELQALILDMKREDPGRSVPLIIRACHGPKPFDPRQGFEGRRSGCSASSGCLRSTGRAWRAGARGNRAPLTAGFVRRLTNGAHAPLGALPRGAEP